jgi:hypothetical protein
VFEQDESRDVGAVVGVIDQDGPLFHEVVILLAHKANDGIEQRVTRIDEGRDRLLVVTFPRD